MDKWIHELYKTKGDFLRNTTESRRSAALNNRRANRNSVLQKFRNIPNMSQLESPAPNEEVKNGQPKENKIVKNRRLEMMLKWKQEKERKKQEEKAKQKPLFKVCHLDRKENLTEIFTHIKGKKIPIKVKTPEKYQRNNSSFLMKNCAFSKSSTNLNKSDKSILTRLASTTTTTLTKESSKKRNEIIAKGKGTPKGTMPLRTTGRTQLSILKDDVKSNKMSLPKTSGSSSSTSSKKNSRKNETRRKDEEIGTDKQTNIPTIQEDESSETLANNDYSLIITKTEDEPASNKRKSIRISVQKTNPDDTISFIKGNQNSSITRSMCNSNSHSGSVKVTNSAGPSSPNKTEEPEDGYRQLLLVPRRTPRREKTVTASLKTPRSSRKSNMSSMTIKNEEGDMSQEDKKRMNHNRKSGKPPSEIDSSSVKSPRKPVSLKEDEDHSTPSGIKGLSVGSAKHSVRRSMRRLAAEQQDKESGCDTNAITTPCDPNNRRKSTVSSAKNSVTRSRRKLGLDELKEEIGGFTTGTTPSSTNVVKSTPNVSSNRKSARRSRRPPVIEITEECIDDTKMATTPQISKRKSTANSAKINVRRSMRKSGVDALKEHDSDDEISLNKEELLAKPKSQRRSILTTPLVGWKLLPNDSYLETTTSGGVRRSSSNKRTSNIKTSVDSDLSPNKFADDDKTNDAVFVTPDKQSDLIVYISPFVTSSRGKSAARKEFEHRRSGSEFNTSVSNILDPRSPKAAAAYFTRTLNNEISKIQEKCDLWQTYKEEENLSEDACGLIDMTIGQSNLLISKKFNQFRGLIEKCQKNDESDMKIQCEDLHGFWDMIYKQVTDLDKRFANLEDMKKNNWLEEAPKKNLPKKKAGGRKKGKAKSSSACSSLLKQTILAGRRKKNFSDQGIEMLTVNGKSDTIERSALNKSLNKSDIATPGRGILKTGNTRSEKRKAVVFRESLSKESGKENQYGSADSQKTNNRRSRSSLGRSKLYFE